MKHRYADAKKPGPTLSRTGAGKAYCARVLVANGATEVYASAVAWSADDAERGAEDVCVGEAPPRVIQDVVEAGEKLEASPLRKPEIFRH